jgi:hypothetical protein
MQFLDLISRCFMVQHIKEIQQSKGVLYLKSPHGATSILGPLQLLKSALTMKLMFQKRCG